MSIDTTIFVTLPEQIKDLLVSEELIDHVEGIAKSEKLEPKFYGDLYYAVVDVLTGRIRPNQFVARISEDANVDQEQASQIAQVVNREIFNSIKEELKQVHGLVASPVATVEAANPAAPEKTGPSSYAAPETVAAIVAPQIMPSMPIVTAPKMDAPPAPSPFMATLNVAAMKAEPVVPPMLVMPSPQASEMQKPLPQAPFQEPMRTIAMDQPRAPIMTPPSVLVSTTAPLQNIPTPEQLPMNIFEEKLGTAFRMKSESVESVVAAPLNTSPVVPSTPANPLPQAMPAMSLPRTPSAPIIEVVPTPTAPTIPPPMVGGDPYRETP